MKPRIKEPILSGEKICPYSSWRKSPQIGCVCMCVYVYMHALLLNPGRLIDWIKIYSLWFFLLHYLDFFGGFPFNIFFISEFFLKVKKYLISILQALKCNMGITFSLYLQILFLVVLKKYKRLKMNNGVGKTTFSSYSEMIFFFLNAHFFVVVVGKRVL